MASLKPVIFSPQALRELDGWKQADPKVLIRIIGLITEIAASPFTGTGKPEPLKHQLKGKWSRRINQEHRLVYEVTDDAVFIVSCRYHY